MKMKIFFFFSQTSTFYAFRSQNYPSSSSCSYYYNSFLLTRFPNPKLIRPLTLSEGRTETKQAEKESPL